VHKYEFYEEVTLLNLVFVPKAIEYSLFMEKLYPLEFVIAFLDSADLERLVTYVEQIEREISIAEPHIIDSSKTPSAVISSSILLIRLRDKSAKI
jgi:hypothetical protein